MSKDPRSEQPAASTSSDASGVIKSVSREARKFPPPAGFKAHALLVRLRRVRAAVQALDRGAGGVLGRDGAQGAGVDQAVHQGAELADPLGEVVRGRRAQSVGELPRPAPGDPRRQGRAAVGGGAGRRAAHHLRRAALPRSFRESCAISIAASPASNPLFPLFNPARSIACSSVSHVSTQKIIGTPAIHLRQLQPARRLRANVIVMRSLAAQTRTQSRSSRRTARSPPFSSPPAAIQTIPARARRRHRSSAAPARSNASSAAASNRSVMKLLNRLTTIPKRNPAAAQLAADLPGFNFSAISLSARRSIYFPLKLRRPLLHKRPVPSRISSVAQDNPNSVASRNKSLFLRHLHSTLDRFHRVLHRQRRVRDNFLRHRFRRRQKFRRLINPIHQPDPLRLFRRNHFARQTQFMRHAFAAQPRQPLRSAVTRNNSELHFRLPQLRRLARDADRARQRHLASAAQRKPIDRANRRLPHRLQQMKHALPKQRKIFSIDGRSLRQFTDIRARNKRLSRPPPSKSQHAPPHHRAHPINASRNSSTVFRFSAFNTFGRLNVMNAIPSRFSTIKFSNAMFPLEFRILNMSS